MTFFVVFGHFMGDNEMAQFNALPVGVSTFHIVGIVCRGFPARRCTIEPSVVSGRKGTFHAGRFIEESNYS
jgi:hypothetical protein